MRGSSARRAGWSRDENDPGSATGASKAMGRTGGTMINNYRDHAANERTFLAWLRTGLTIVAFGFVIQRMNIHVTAATGSTSDRFPLQDAITAILAGVGRYDGLALSVIGIVIILLGGVRFVRAAREIESPERYTAGMSIELLLTGALAILTATLCAYFSVT